MTKEAKQGNAFDASEMTAALSRVLEAYLREHRSAKIPHVGMFEITHARSEVNELEGGKIEMTPPHHSITFEPAESF